VRVLFFSPHYGTMGGVRSIIDALARTARSAGHDVAAVVDGDAARAPGQAVAVRLYPFPARAREIRRLRRFAQKFPVGSMRLVAAVRGAAPDVVSVHCMRRFAPYAALLRRATGVPQVLNLQEGALPPGMPENPGLFRLLARTADAVAERAGLSLSRTLAALGALEVRGLVRRRGGRYEAPARPV